MIKKYNTINKYEFVRDWYVQIDTPMNMFPEMYLFGSSNEKDPYILGIVVNCYVDGESDIIIQVGIVKETGVKLFYF